jgi:hypothetical protein
MNKNNGQELHIGQGHFMNVKTSTIIKLSEQFVLYTEEGPVSLNVDVSADFAEIDQKYHEIFFNVLTSKYMNKVSFGENPFSSCKPVTKRKWWQFWHSKYFTKEI